MALLISQILAHQFDVDAVFKAVAFDNGPHITEPGGTLTIDALAGFGAGSFPIEADGVDGRR